MANILQGTQKSNVKSEEIGLSLRWTESKTGHCLTVDLPDFRKEHVKVQVMNSKNIKIIGERLDNESRLYFEKLCKVPENTDLDNITAKFNGKILNVTIPKRDEKEEKCKNTFKKEDNNRCHGSPCFCITKWEGEASYLERSMEMLRNNKERFVLATLGFSLGVLLTSKFNREN
ncbi:hypothetical protein UlMin_008182 [Ulmus minor]